MHYERRVEIAVREMSGGWLAVDDVPDGSGASVDEVPADGGRRLDAVLSLRVLSEERAISSDGDRRRLIVTWLAEEDAAAVAPLAEAVEVPGVRVYESHDCTTIAGHREGQVGAAVVVGEGGPAI